VLALLMIGWADLTDATAAERAKRAKRALTGGSGAEIQVRVSVRVYGWICVKTCKKSKYETFIFYAEVLVFSQNIVSIFKL